MKTKINLLQEITTGIAIALADDAPHLWQEASEGRMLWR
jgi:hypothetical protein